jgi:HD superfamily phosphodiesterase
MDAQKTYNRYAEALKKYYKDRDSSHGWSHVEKVAKNALYICQRENIKDEKSIRLIVLAALGHDIWDHKYVASDKEAEELRIRFAKDINELGFLAMDIDLLLRIIDSISFSKEFAMRQEGGEFDLEHHEERLRDIVSDADKLEALGEICIRRMIEYEIVSNIEGRGVSIEDHIHHIRKHCNEKLYLLIDENYIKTPTGRELARPLMSEMKAIVDDDLKLEVFIKSYLSEMNVLGM